MVQAPGAIDALVEIVANPDLYKEQIAEFGRRERAAKKAEKKTIAAQTELIGRQESFAAVLRKHEAEVQEHEARVKKADDRLETTKKEQDRREASLVSWEEDRRLGTEALEAKESDLKAAVSLNASRSDMLDERAAKLDGDRKTFERDKAVLVEKEGRLNANLRDLQKRLEGFSL